MTTQVGVASRDASVQQAASDAWKHHKSASASSAGEKKAANMRQRHQEGPAAFAERKDAVKEYMDRRLKSTPPAKTVRYGLPKFTNIYEYLRHAPEEPMVDMAKALAMPAKQRSKKSKHNEADPFIEPGENVTESLSEGWVDIAATIEYSILKARHPPRKSVEASNAAPRQTIDMEATSKTSQQNGLKSPRVPGFNLHTEQ